MDYNIISAGLILIAGIFIVYQDMKIEDLKDEISNLKK